MLTKAAFIWLKYSKTLIFWNTITIWQYFKISFILDMEELNFQSAVSHDPSKIILICLFAAQETFLIILNVENLVFILKQKSFAKL